MMSEVYIKRHNDNRVWRVIREKPNGVFAEWIGKGPYHWPGHEYAIALIPYEDIVEEVHAATSDDQEQLKTYSMFKD
jgi:hypothetical protein